jgi:hypothetical protein
MIFDVTSEMTSRIFLCDFLDIESKGINEYIEMSNDDIYVDEFLEFVERSLEDRNIDDIHLSVLHVTTNNDECNTILDIGLVNLQQALTMETPLRQYLRHYGIQFDVHNNLMCMKGRFHKIVYDSSFYETETVKGKLNSIARKIYYDHQINGFFCVRDTKGYGGYVHLRPEIIYDLALLGKESHVFERKWVEDNKPYVIKFNAPLEYFTYYSFYGDIESFKDDYIDKSELKKWLVKTALHVVWEYHYYDQCPNEIMAYLKPEVSIPASYIVDIQPIT